MTDSWWFTIQRADGSFADWQIENQGPALATNSIQNSKLPLLEGALLGLRVGDFATTLRTHPPTDSVLPAAEALSYSGAYPFARLGLADSRLPDGLSAQVFAYSAVKLHDVNASALPAVAFTLVLENKGPTAVNASFLLTLPLAATLHTSRHTSIIQKYGTVPLTNDSSIIKTLGKIPAAACLTACGSTPNCTYWDVDLQGSPGVPAVPAIPPQVSSPSKQQCAICNVKLRLKIRTLSRRSRMTSTAQTPTSARAISGNRSRRSKSATATATPRKAVADSCGIRSDLIINQSSPNPQLMLTYRQSS